VLLAQRMVARAMKIIIIQKMVARAEDGCSRYEDYYYKKWLLAQRMVARAMKIIITKNGCSRRGWLLEL
jgi:hypothetical protein